MKNKYLSIKVLVGMFILTGMLYTSIDSAFSMCGTCGMDSANAEEGETMFSHVAKEADMKNDVKEISYDQFMAIKNAGENYRLLDVLSQDSYNQGHIPGSESFPVDKINKETAEGFLSMDDHVIVYCGSFQCSASTQAANKLTELGYNVVDYKGGLKDWQEKGNSLVS
ncbi:MAG: rhodanese-like domain-containing protein [Candidatus Omnitrophica bacterium]|nr:rhodanese-like domain-containing protein [Candidatus Omnitrophota bacterium]